jgi:hypothetical protein
MDRVKADIIARVHLYRTEAGGRSKALPAAPFGCPFFYEGEGFDCRLLLDQVLAPGTTAEVPIKFLNPGMVKPRLSVGARFKLWEAGDFADGEVLEVTK